ncbi:MAG: hypothetical protein HFE76_16795 [Firmicutes bacterium]|nr:hypothetical protein [Bacillota bacterium]
MKNYKQTDIRWCNVPYAGSTIGRAGCGPTAVADIAGKTPKTIAAWMAAHGCASNGQGTYWGGITKALKHYGYEAAMLNSSNAYGKKGTEAEAKFKKKLKSGKYWGILLMGKSIFTSGGHYITIEKYTKKKGYKVLDPYSGRLCGYHTWKDFDGKVKIFYLIKKPVKKSKEKPKQPADKKKAIYYITPKGNTTSLVDALKAIGVDANFENRKKIAAKNGIQDYSGTQSQNEALRSKLYKGKLKR